MRQAAAALVTILSTYVEDGKLVFPPESARDRPVVTVTALEAAKLGLHDAMLAADVSNVQLAQRLGTGEKAVRRLRDPLHWSHIGAVEAALAVLGSKLNHDYSQAAVVVYTQDAGLRAL